MLFGQKEFCFCKIQNTTYKNTKKCSLSNFISKRSQFFFSCELGKNILNMFLTKIVVLTLLRYPSIFSKCVQMFSQLSILSHLNKQFYYCASSQHALHLEKIMWQLIKKWSLLYILVAWFMLQLLLSLLLSCNMVQSSYFWWINISWSRLRFVYSGPCAFHCNCWM